MTKRTIETLTAKEPKPWKGFVPHPDLPETAKATLLKIKHKSFVLENLSSKIDAPNQHLICTICPHAQWMAMDTELKAHCGALHTLMHSTDEPGALWICDKNQPEDETPQENAPSQEGVPESETQLVDPFVTDLVDKL